MKIGIITKIIRGEWAIDADTAIGYMPLINSILSGNFKPKANGEDDDDENENRREKNIFKPQFLDAQGNYYCFGKKAPVPGCVAVIPIIGPIAKYDEIGYCAYIAGMQTIGEWIDEAKEDNNVDAIILRMDCPGGTVDGTANLAEIIAEANKVKPVIAFVDGLMASAAYWLGSYCQEIICSNGLDRVGSIGVMLSFADLQGILEKEGANFHFIVSDLSPDKNKDFMEAKLGNYELIKNESLNPIADEFRKVVSTNRKKMTEEQLTGKVYFAKYVLKSMVDSIGNFDYAVGRARELSRSKNIINIRFNYE